jgi:hypothetical protein
MSFFTFFNGGLIQYKAAEMAGTLSLGNNTSESRLDARPEETHEIR